MWRALALSVWLSMGAFAAVAQTTVGLPPPVLVIDQERLFQETAFGRQVLTQFESAARELAAENRRIEADLEAEEQALTDQRATVTAEEFRVLADAFDEKVQRIRVEQDQKSIVVTQLRDEGRQTFFQALGPVLSTIVRERGALILIDRRNVVLSADALDITDEAIQRIDQRLSQPAGE